MPNHKGFTIVELLIVIVVIAILAAITLVAYNGMQQRANNAAIIQAAESAVNVTKAYIAANGTYPTTSYVCLSADCHWGSASSSWNVNASNQAPFLTIGSLPGVIPKATAAQNGIAYNYNASRTFNGTANPVLIVYWLFGEKTNCGLSNLADGTSTTTLSTSQGYTTSYTGNGYTTCAVAVAGP